MVIGYILRRNLGMEASEDELRAELREMGYREDVIGYMVKAANQTVDEFDARLHNPGSGRAILESPPETGG